MKYRITIKSGALTPADCFVFFDLNVATRFIKEHEDPSVTITLTTEVA